MIAEFAKKINEMLTQKGIVQKEDVEMYQYGIENGIVVAGNLLVSAIFGIVTGRLGLVLVFLLFYATLRSYSRPVFALSEYLPCVALRPALLALDTGRSRLESLACLFGLRLLSAGLRPELRLSPSPSARSLRSPRPDSGRTRHLGP